MRKYLISAAVLTLLAAPSAWSDPPADRGNKGNEGHARAEPNRQGPPPGRQSDRGDRGPPPQASMQRAPDRGPGPQASMQGRTDRGDQRRGFERGNRGPQMSFQAPPNRDQNPGRGDRGPGPQASNQAPPNRGDNNRPGFNDNRPNRDVNRDFNRDGRTDFRPNRGAAPHRDFSGFRDYHRDFRVSRRFYAPAYRRPAGWYEHRWTFGEFLPVAFWARDYWLVDFAIYDLPPPPFGAVWVRVGYDALLIDDETGEIITVAYDVFY